MDYGNISLPKGVRPRMELYDGRILSKQIMAETIGLKGKTPCRLFGAGKVSPSFIFFSIGAGTEKPMQIRCYLKVHAIYSQETIPTSYTEGAC
jgi:hypothetical protein